MTDIFSAYQVAIGNNTDNLRKLNDLLLKVVTLHTLHEDEDLMSGLDFIFYGNQILICSKVDKLSDIEPLLHQWRMAPVRMQDGQLAARGCSAES